MSNPAFATEQARWRAQLEALPSNPEAIPAFFFAHGSPALAFPAGKPPTFFGGAMAQWVGLRGPLAMFLRDFGPALLEKYNPKAIVVFSAHWETYGETLVTDYGDDNPLLMDYFNFPPDLYELKFKSRGDSDLAARIVSLYEQAGHKARVTPRTEARGEDGRGFSGPGLDHGVFVPFRLMFGEELAGVPIVQVSIDGSMSPQKNWAVGEAVSQLRREGYLVLSGGLTAHNQRDRSSFSRDTAKPVHHEFDQAIHQAIGIADSEQRRQALMNLVDHPAFRASHPREDHFVPIYVAAGAGADGGAVRVINDIYGIPTFAFGDAESLGY
ncbi:Extradiol ring-cleavage dioxygenase, class III enzyme, subunit B [Schizophyllum amplum]|uniref:Extradiol ring-cleavage dioxygenase, class III enzyme, subunit B n=1 Tax=Schizophyllum amplum TaxID=97359 RepID=A0A550C0I5_9AGAR|nr:Extradiol ring-cleavage dioxygenase, class III enzyme, subunit B [Auriculariopsis ampla]